VEFAAKILLPKNQSGGWHFNSLLQTADELFLLAHNYGPSEVFVFAADTLAFRRSFPLGNQAHNLWFEGDRLLVCSSGDHAIVSEGCTLARTGHFPRGVVATSQGQYVGISTYSKARETRALNDSYIAHFDPEWRFTKCYRLVGEGLVYDIRCPGWADASHPQCRGGTLDWKNIQDRCVPVAIEECALPV
jgi:hypothetical protein